MRLFGSRKALRHFDQSPSAGRGWRFEKSSLDGARESVLNPKAEFPKDIRLRLRLASNEHLCAVGVTKRLGVQRMPFPSVVRIAIDPWIRGIVSSGDQTAIACLQDIKKNCEGDNRFSSGTGARKDKKFFEDFPFDGQVFFPSRLEDLKNDPDIPGESVDSKKLSQIKESIRQLRNCTNGHPEFGEPNPYFAILVADGDRMGRVISNIQSKDEHKKFSATLARFAGKARDIVENDKHHGVLVYAGGEDVLAFLPVDTCIGAARELHDEFGNLLKEFKDDTGKTPTLSVGLSIGHALEPLGDLIDYVHESEQDAKEPDRDGLAVHYHIRSGGDPIKVREEWTPKDIVNKKGDVLNVVPLDKRLETWIGFFLEDRFPDGAANDLRQLAEDYRGWQTIPEDLLIRDIERLLRRKQTGENKGINENDLKLVLAGVTTYERLLQRATELILARKIAESAKQAQSNNQNQPGIHAHRNVQEAA
jgi:CRISPR-associated protein Cmr2